MVLQAWNFWVVLGAYWIWWEYPLHVNMCVLSVVITRFGVCFLISMSHSVHTLGLANFGVFRLSDYFFSMDFCHWSLEFLEELTYTSISWVMLSLLTTFHLFASPRLSHLFYVVQAWGKGFLRVTNQAHPYYNHSSLVRFPYSWACQPPMSLQNKRKKKLCTRKKRKKMC